MASLPRSYREQITAFIDKELSPAAISKKVAAIARKRRDELIAEGRASRRYSTYVDGSLGSSEDLVKRNITYRFSNVAAAVDFCINELILGSPVGDGKKRGPHYYQSFYVSVNGSPMRAASFDPARCPPDATCYIYNSQPYGRKIDVQYVGSQHIEFSVPAGLFARVVTRARREFGNQTSIKRIYSVTVPGQWVTRKGRLVEYPAIMIEPGIF